MLSQTAISVFSGEVPLVGPGQYRKQCPSTLETCTEKADDLRQGD